MDMSLILILSSSLLIPIISHYWLAATITKQEFYIHCILVVVVLTTVWNLGKWNQSSDTEIWNGSIISKHRDHGTYEQSYDCNCSSDSDGNESCSTCYETHYTVDWYAHSDIGTITFASKDSEWRTVYNSSDPTAYTNCAVNQPVALSKPYTNYIKAVPQSLFHTSTINGDFDGKIPKYPHVYNFYQIDRVINIDSVITADVVASLDAMLDAALKKLGPIKQSNIIVILTEIDDSSYRYAVEQKWLGGKKNDIVIFIGLDGDTITWVDVMTWALNTGNELFHVTMRDGIMNQATFNHTTLVPFISNTVLSLYDRPQMKDYEYVAEQITPPTWVVILCLILGYGGGLFLTFYFNKHNINILK